MVESEKKIDHAPAALESINWEQLPPFAEDTTQMNFTNSQLNDEDYKATRRSSPEKNLAAAVMGVAFTDLKPIRAAEDREMAYNFIMGEDLFHKNDWPFSSEKLADILDLNIEELRRIATLMYHNPSQFRW